MNWSTPRELKAQLARRWERGELLRPLVSGEPCFPLRLTLKAPGSNDISERFDAVRTWAGELAAQTPLRIEWREIRHRVQGAQRLPAAVWIDSADAALTWLGKRHDADRFAALVAATRASLPLLLPWLARRPLDALKLADAWPRLLAVVGWLAAHPLPGVYLRQIDVPGVHSKFIEAHRGVLAELFDLVLPATAVLTEHAGSAQFARRYGFREKPIRIRLRLLDPNLASLPGLSSSPSCPDLTLDADSFARLELPLKRVFITENETNFLAFPPVSAAIVIFGAGYGWEALGRAHWLQTCVIHYWGDIDTHGFAILDQLRRRFAHVASFLMDRETLITHAAHWGEETDQVMHDLPCLNAEECALFDDLRDNHVGKHLRLEQERVGFQWVMDGLSRVLARPAESTQLFCPSTPRG